MTYGKIWGPVCLAFTAAAYLVFRLRKPSGIVRRLLRLALIGYLAMTLSVCGDYVTPWWMDQKFILGIGAMLIIGLGGIPLGILMLRHRFRSRVIPVLLMIFPFMLAITQLTSLAAGCCHSRGAGPSPHTQQSPPSHRTTTATPSPPSPSNDRCPGRRGRIAAVGLATAQNTVAQSRFMLTTVQSSVSAWVSACSAPAV